MTKNFNILVNKLKGFKQRYYLLELLRGLLLVAGTFLLLFTVFSIVEYFLYLPSDVRKTTFLGSIVFLSLMTVGFVLVPLFRLLNILRPLSKEQISAIIRQHFPEIQDKLLNTLELAESEDKDNELLQAGIDQKIEELKAFDFKQAVTFEKLSHVLVFLGVGLLVTVLSYVYNSSIFPEGTNRIIHYNKTFEKPTPFRFVVDSSSQAVLKGEPYVFRVCLEGDELPEVLYVNIEGNNYLMESKGDSCFEFHMASVLHPLNYFFTDLRYRSQSGYLKVLPKPGIESFSVKVEPPAYTRLNLANFEGQGDLQVPQGAVLTWLFRGVDIDSLYLVFNDSSRVNAELQELRFVAQRQIFTSGSYDVYIRNLLTKPELALSYSIEVIPDLYPEIKVVQVQDSLRLTRFFFKGAISDDYGFHNLSFHLNIENKDSAIVLPVNKHLVDQDFYFAFDFAELPQEIREITYYFTVTDNDALHGYKTTSSKSFQFVFPSEEEIQSIDKETFKRLESKFKESKNLVREIQSDIKNLQLKNMDNSLSDWQKSELVNEIARKQSRLEQLYQEIKQENERLNDFLQSFSEQDEAILEKQKQIEELLQEVFTDELRKLMEEFQKLAEDFDSKKLNQMADQLDLGFDDLQKQLDKNLEMLKKMKVEQHFQAVIDQLNDMSEEQRSYKTNDLPDRAFDKGVKLLNEHLGQLDSIQRDLHETLQLNEELKEPLFLSDFKQEFEDLKQTIGEGRSNLEQKRKRRSEESIQNSIDQLENLAFSMQQMLDMQTAQQTAENIRNLRQILDNLVYLSFAQEQIMQDLNGMNSSDPLLVEINRRQHEISDQTVVVRDSLYTLAERVPQLNSVVNNELLSIQLYQDKVIGELEEGLLAQAVVSQQFVLTSFNNLALLLDEVIQQLEKQQANAQPGDQQCENPGGKGQGLPQLKQATEGLKEQLQKMIDQMKNGGGQGMSKELGQALLQHEMLQQMLRDLMNNGSVGSGAAKTLQEVDRLLEENRKMLINKNVSSDMIQRINQITTRLLEAERAENERDFDEKRESESAKEFYSNPATFFEYIKRDEIGIERLQRGVHQLAPFYKQKYRRYIEKSQQ